MPDTSFEIIGPRGCVTAIHAAQLGFEKAIVEKSDLGGMACGADQKFRLMMMVV
jgi:hypothetical protein